MMVQVNDENSTPAPPDAARTGRALTVLTERQIRQIDRVLADSGPFAEIRLIKEKGRLRFIKKMESVDAAQ
jgi:hypothetical protein